MQPKKPLRAKTPLKAKQPIAKRPKQHTISWYKHQADKYWSQATRLRHSYLKDGERWAECITCKTPAPITKLQCGHFQSRQYNSTRFNDLNTAPQCYGCNVMQQGKQYEFGLALDELYGAGTAKQMYQLAKIPHQWKCNELIEILNAAKEEIASYGDM